MQKRMIPTMDRHLVKLELLLWPRVKLLLGMHTNSIKRPANPVAGIAAIYGIYTNTYTNYTYTYIHAQHNHNHNQNW